MLNELIKHKHLGSIDNIFFVLHGVLSKKNTKSMSIASVKKYCSDKTLNLIYEIDGILALLEFVEIITRSQDLIKINNKFQKTFGVITNNAALAKIIIEKILVKLKEEGNLEDFIALERIRFDPILNQISILNNLIPLQYSSIKNLLINLGGFKIIPEYPSILLLEESLQSYFESTVIPWMVEEREKSAFSMGVNRLSLEKLLEIQELKNQYGIQAEEYVLQFEQNRLKDHPFSMHIKRISSIDVGAGYDIVSFDGQNSRVFDRFIEVKSYSRNTEFYWSRTEVRVAEEKKDNYYLYLVDRDQMALRNYQPIIIQDPFQVIFNNSSWQKDPQNWLIKKIDTVQVDSSPKISAFISYSHVDKDFAKIITEELSQNGYIVWWDHTLKGGQDWQEEIQKGITNCSYFLVILTTASVASDWVTSEIIMASQKGKTIIPLKFEECDIPLSIIKKQYIDFEKQSQKAALKELVDLLGIWNRRL